MEATVPRDTSPASPSAHRAGTLRRTAESAARGGRTPQWHVSRIEVANITTEQYDQAVAALSALLTKWHENIPEDEAA